MPPCQPFYLATYPDGPGAPANRTCRQPPRLGHLRSQPSDLRAAAGRIATTARYLCTAPLDRPMLLGMTRQPRPTPLCNCPARPVDAARIKTALLKVAVLVAKDAAFTPIFERLEAELAAALTEEWRLSEAQRRARALLSQKAMRRTSSATCSSDAPLPYRSRSSR